MTTKPESDHIGERNGMIPNKEAWWWLDDTPVNVRDACGQLYVSGMAGGDDFIKNIDPARWGGRCLKGHPPGQEGEAVKRIWIGEENNALCVRYEDGTQAIYSQTNNAPELLAQFLMVNAEKFRIQIDPKSHPQWHSLKATEYCEECGATVPAPQPDAGKAIAALREIKDHCMCEQLSSRRRHSHSLANEIKAICDRALGEKGGAK